MHRITRIAWLVIMACPWPAVADQGVRTLLTIEPTKEHPRNSEGDVLALKDGRLILVYTRFYGGAKDSSAAHIVARTSADGGATWSDDRVLVDNEGAENVMSASLLRLTGGDILLFYLRKNGWDDCHVVVRRSTDDLATLGEPVQVSDAAGYHVMNNDRVVRLKSGRLIAPTALHLCRDGTYATWTPRGIPVVYTSDDDGRTWRRSDATLAYPDTSDPMLQEPGVVELADGRLWMWMRTGQGVQYESFSRDQGIGWTPPRPGTLASPRSPATIERVPWSGDLLCVWNDHSGRHVYPEGKRSPLCVALSRDDGRTWTPSRVIEGDPDGWYCYASITFLDDRALLTYCAGDPAVGGLNRLKMIAIHRAWLERE